MTAIADLSAVINRLTGGNSGAPEHITHQEDNRIGAAAAAATVAGRWSSLWQYNGSPGGGAVPGAAAVPTNASAGSLKQTDPAGGRQKWLLGWEALSTQGGVLVLYDRLLHNGGLSGTSTGAQTVGGSLTRYATNALCVGNEIWVEVYTALGSTATTITASYTNQAGTAGQVTPAAAIGGTGLNEATRMIPLSLAAGDSGVQAVATVTLAASTLTAGSFGVTILRPLAILPISMNTLANLRDFLSGVPSVPEIATGACLALAFLAQGTTAPQVLGMLHMVDN